MSCFGYVAFQATSPEVLLSCFYSNLAGHSRVALGYVQQVLPCWEFAREAAVRGGEAAKRKTRNQEHGILPVAKGELVAVWSALPGDVCHMVLCNRETSVEIALNFLTVFGAVLADHCKGGARETFVVKPDEALILLDQFLPSGQLLVLSNALIKHLKVQADTMILQKV